MLKIDFVLPWVDGNDTDWQKEKNKHQKSPSAEHNSDARYRDMDTLKYVLRSIEKNCPWYNKIHLITCGHSPKWLDINHPKINLITHEQMYFKTEHLPTFSSSSIEMNLANLQGVTEQFVYLNDDTLIINETPSERFFKNGKPVDFLSHGWVPRNTLFKKIRGMDPWVYSIVNNLNLINKKFKPLVLKKNNLYHNSYNLKSKLSNYLLQNIYKKFVWLEHWHHPQPYLMTTLKEVYNAFPEEMMDCSKNKFRENNDLTQYIYRYWRLARNEFYPYRYNDGIEINVLTEKQLKDLLTLIESNDKPISFICFNDSERTSNIEYKKIKATLIDYLEKKFPSSASFEI